MQQVPERKVSLFNVPSRSSWKEKKSSGRECLLPGLCPKASPTDWQRRSRRLPCEHVHSKPEDKVPPKTLSSKERVETRPESPCIFSGAEPERQKFRWARSEGCMKNSRTQGLLHHSPTQTASSPFPGNFVDPILLWISRGTNLAWRNYVRQ